MYSDCDNTHVSYKSILTSLLSRERLIPYKCENFQHDADRLPTFYFKISLICRWHAHRKQSAESFAQCVSLRVSRHVHIYM